MKNLTIFAVLAAAAMASSAANLAGSAGNLAGSVANLASGAAKNIFATYEIKPERVSKLGFGTPGIVSAVAVDLGDEVHAGQVLARLESGVESARLAAAKAAEKLALSSLARANAAGKALSKAALDEARAAADNARAQVDLARAALALKELKAPFSGKIAARYAQLGDGFASPAQPAFELVSSGRKLVEISFDVDAAAAVKSGDKFCFNAADAAAMTSAAGAGATTAGGAAQTSTASGAAAGAAQTSTASGEICLKIERLSPVGNLRSKKILAQAFADESLPLAPGSFGEGHIR